MQPTNPLFTELDKYILDDHNNVVAVDLLTWGTWYQTNHDKKIVRQETINDLRVSTVFIGINHNSNDNELHIFETMVFEDRCEGHSIYCDRYPTWDKAIDGHEKAVRWVKNKGD